METSSFSDGNGPRPRRGLSLWLFAAFAAALGMAWGAGLAWQGRHGMGVACAVAGSDAFHAAAPDALDGVPVVSVPAGHPLTLWVRPPFRSFAPAREELLLDGVIKLVRPHGIGGFPMEAALPPLAAGAHRGTLLVTRRDGLPLASLGFRVTAR